MGFYQITHCLTLVQYYILSFFTKKNIKSTITDYRRKNTGLNIYINIKIYYTIVHTCIHIIYKSIRAKIYYTIVHTRIHIYKKNIKSTITDYRRKNTGLNKYINVKIYYTIVHTRIHIIYKSIRVKIYYTIIHTCIHIYKSSHNKKYKLQVIIDICFIGPIFTNIISVYHIKVMS